MKDSTEIIRKNRIASLDAVRTICSIMIVLNHCTFLKQSARGNFIFEHFLHNGSFEVAFYFCVSAFLLYYVYGEKYIENEIGFLKKNVSKFYLLYMVTNTWVAICLVLKGTSIYKIACQWLLSATLLQTMTLKGYRVLNSACWYLSTLTVLYFIAPFMMRFIKKLSQKQVYIFTMVLITLIFLIHLVVNILVKGAIISSDTAILLTYIFPLYWMPAYMLGMLANRWIIFDKHHTCTEILFTILAGGVYWAGINGPIWFTEYKNLFYIIVWLPIIVIFSKEEGWISKTLSKTKFVKFTPLTMEVYIIHYVVIYFGGNMVIELLAGTVLGEFIAVIFVFAVTILASIVWEKFYKKVCCALKA